MADLTFLAVYLLSGMLIVLLFYFHSCVFGQKPNSPLENWLTVAFWGPGLAAGLLYCCWLVARMLVKLFTGR